MVASDGCAGVTLGHEVLNGLLHLGPVQGQQGSGQHSGGAHVVGVQHDKDVMPGKLRHHNPSQAEEQDSAIGPLIDGELSKDRLIFLGRVGVMEVPQGRVAGHSLHEVFVGLVHLRHRDEGQQLHVHCGALVHHTHPEGGSRAAPHPWHGVPQARGGGEVEEGRAGGLLLV